MSKVRGIIQTKVKNVMILRTTVMLGFPRIRIISKIQRVKQWNCLLIAKLSNLPL